MNVIGTKRGALTAAILVFIAVGLAASRTVLRGEEGQYPLSMLATVDLKAKGFEITMDDLYKPGAVSLIDAICRVGGATGSFVSSEGLIVTNHHVAFDALARASTPETDHLTKGFAAPSREAELPARGYRCRITTSYKDVSAEVLAAVDPKASPADRSRAVSKKVKEIADLAKAEKPGTDAEVAEMFQGKSYVLFTYEDIVDVRIVAAPPRAVGEYGGEEDNWVWPRHTGDFTFLRAYVGPDGKPAPYSSKNVPFKPRRHLRIEPRGVAEGDLVFILGYPGRTYRHQSSHFMEFEERVRLGFIADLFAAQIAAMEKAGLGNPELALRVAPAIKGKANTMKNFRGKIQGLKRLSLVAKKRAEEAELQAWIDADPARKAKWGGVLSGIAAVYETAFKTGARELVMQQTAGASMPLGLAFSLAREAEQAALPEEKRDKMFAGGARQRREMRKRATAAAIRPLEIDLTTAMLLAARKALGADGFPELDQVLAAAGGDAAHPIEDRVRALVQASKLFETEFVEAAAGKSADELKALKEPLIDLATAMLPGTRIAEEAGRDRKGRLDALLADFVDAKEAWKTAAFIPDANSTLRFTFGNVRGYSPRDGLVATPFTTLSGVVQKATGADPYDPPALLVERWKAKDLGDFADPLLKDVPVALLYDTDTTGGNSGSPVMNKRGDLIAVNFDRTFEATINDYEWSSDYSRSIGVDIRYVLWVTQKVIKAEAVVAELLR